jgi:acyl carrier protein
MNDIRKTIHAKVTELARQLGRDATGLRYDQEIPAAGVLDSPTLMELIMWFENEFGLELEQDELTLENFGTIDSMASYAEKARS